MFRIIISVAVLNFVFALPVQETPRACQKQCHPVVDGKINIHLVPHSHDDVGWLNTWDGYYTGTGDFSQIATAGVQYIISSTVEELNKNPDRRFIQVETAFFFKWWNDQTPETRDLVRDLVNNGQLEIINGAWSMNDEAAAHYQSIIDQYTWGFRIIEDTIGECARPKIGWQIDPFGHSKEHASINKLLGFDGLVVGRLDYRDKNKRKAEKNLDLIWNTNANFEDADLFTTMFPDFYVFPPGFCVDVYCNDPNITDDNLEERVNAFKTSLDEYKEYYKTSNVMVPMGHDFSYQKAEKNFNNIDKLIEGFNGDETYNVIYSTPSCYIQAVKDEVAQNSIELLTKTDDFFPYASDPSSYWTGYFTSRPTAKRFERLGNNILQSTKQLTTISRIQGSNDDDILLKLRMAMGVIQHHDAVTGTEKQFVAEDYNLLLNEGIRDTEKTLGDIMKNLLKKGDEVPDLSFEYCLRANVSVCYISKGIRFVVAVQNPLSHPVSHFVKLPVDGENYKVTGPEEDGEIVIDVFDSIDSFAYIDDAEPATKELVFLAQNLPPLGVKLYYIEKIDGSSYHKFEEITTDPPIFGNDDAASFTIDGNGKLMSAKINGEELAINQDFYYYRGKAGPGRASGAYVFRPDGDSIQISEVVNAKYAQGSLVDQLYQYYSDEVVQIVRVYKNKGHPYIEFDWLVGDLKTDDAGKEVVTRFQAQNFASNEVFYTDSNGRQMMKRVRNKRPDYEYDASSEPVTSNYYPITSKIVIKDEDQNLELAVLTDRAEGGSSLVDGQIEIMVHRRSVKDDGFGVSEVLSENQYGKGLYARGQHLLTFAKAVQDQPSPAVFERDLALKKLLAPVIQLADASADSTSLENIQNLLNFKFEMLSQSVPGNLHIMTLEPWRDNYLLRLEHIFEKDEDSVLSQEASIELKNLFNSFIVTEAALTTLGANEILSTDFDENFTVTLNPMEIKTILFKTNGNNDGGHNNGIVD